MTASKPYEDLLLPWSSERYGIDFSAARRAVLNSIHWVTLKPEQVAGVPQRWCVLDYPTMGNPSTSSTITFQVEQPMRAFGCCFWFDTVLFEDIGYTTAPGRPDSVYGQEFFPWLEPVSLSPGDRICFELRADLIGEGYVWTWKTTIRDEVLDNSPKTSFSQSSFLATSLPAKLLQRRSSGHVPALDEQGEMDRFLLNRMDGHASLEEIAQALAKHFPHHCARWEDALDRAIRVAEKYSR